MELRTPNQETAGTMRGNAASRRLRRGRVLLAALGLVAASAASAYAADVCMTLSGGGGAVFKRFKAPGRNKCAPIHGFENLGGGAVLSGSACTTPTGEVMILHYTAHDWRATTGYFESGTCRVLLPLPSSEALCRGSYVLTPGIDGGQFNQTAILQYCDAPVPN